MTKKIMMKWVKALRSGKYKQGKHKLHDTATNTYCCLGVAEALNLAKRQNGDDLLENCFLDYDIQNRLARLNDGGKSFSIIANEIEANYKDYYNEEKND